MANVVPDIKMNNGYVMPGFGLGTLDLWYETDRALKYAIDIGYRHFDTAYLFYNEGEVGQAIRHKIEDGVVKREDLFIVTKLCVMSKHHNPELVERFCRESLEIEMEMDYIDLCLMHYPMGFAAQEPLYEFHPRLPDDLFDHTDVDYVDTWRAMEELVDMGIVRSIGVSNFNSQQIDRLLANCRIKPVNNQIEVSPNIVQKKLIKHCNDLNIIVTAYCPLARPQPKFRKPEFLYDNKVKKIADKYNKTTAQIALRYLLDIGTIPIPKSGKEKHIKENMEIFDFQLNENEKNIMDSYNSGDRIVKLSENAHHKYYPFNSE